MLHVSTREPSLHDAESTSIYAMIPELLPPDRLPVFYINLSTRPDRRVFMEQQLERLGIVAERIEAATIGEVPQSLIDIHSSRQLAFPVSVGDLACGLSHQSVWRRMAELRVPAAVVLEDDAMLSDTVLPFLAADILQRLNADLVHLETRRSRVCLGPPRTEIGAIRVHELQSSHMGAAAYIVSQSIAEASLRHPLVNMMGVDRFLFGRGGPHLLCSKVLQLYPSPAVQLDRLDTTEVTKSARQSNLAELRAEIVRRGGREPFGEFLKHQLDHLGRLIRVVSRDPAFLLRRRSRVPYAEDLRTSQVTP
jgi:glycosyl transferase family 25